PRRRRRRGRRPRRRHRAPELRLDQGPPEDDRLLLDDRGRGEALARPARRGPAAAPQPAVQVLQDVRAEARLPRRLAGADRGRPGRVLRVPALRQALGADPRRGPRARHGRARGLRAEGGVTWAALRAFLGRQDAGPGGAVLRDLPRRRITRREAEGGAVVAKEYRAPGLRQRLAATLLGPRARRADDAARLLRAAGFL